MTDNKALSYKLLNSISCFVYAFILFCSILQQHIADTEVGPREGILYNKSLKYMTLETENK